MITSSKLNSVTFKNLSGQWPNKWNTLHEDRNQGGFNVKPYCQRFNKDNVIYLQFTSDSATVPVLKSYSNLLNETINGTLVSSYVGEQSRYFYNFSITLGASYYDKKTWFTVEQDGNTLTSEYILCEDLTDDIQKGKIKYVKYTNLDRNESDLSDYWVDWSVIDYMYFYVEAVDVDTNDIEETEVLEGSQSKTIIAASVYSGIRLRTGGVTDYMAIKLKLASSLDYFEVNGIQYIKEGEVEAERFGNSTLFQVSMNLTEKNTLGINVDDLGVTLTDNDVMAIVTKRNTGVNNGGWQLENPDGYMLHSIFIKHAATSTGDAVVNVGTSVGGDELLDDVQGAVVRADYTTVWKSFSRHYLKDPDNASTLYVSVTGAGAVLDIIFNFDIVTE